MKTIFDARLKAILSLDDEIVRQINHSDEFYACKQDVPRAAALEYLKEIADTLKIPSSALDHANQRVSYTSPMKQGPGYRLSHEKTFFDSTTVGFYQTIQNVPIWRTGVSVTVKHAPNRVVIMTNNSRYDVDVKLPSETKIRAFARLLNLNASENSKQRERIADTKTVDNADSFVNKILRFKPTSKVSSRKTDHVEQSASLIRSRFYVYKYESEKRFIGDDHESDKEGIFAHEKLIQLPKVAPSVKEGQYYLVAEITFSYDHLTWLMLVDVDSSSVLHLEALSSGVNAEVFVQDPITKSGVGTNTPDQPNGVLNAFKDPVVLPNLDMPVGGTQNLRGTFAEVSDSFSPNITVPTNPTGTDFNYDVRTDNFAAANAYYHTDRFFSLVESLGFVIADYFPNTNFPVIIDHRGHSGTGLTINAHCVGNGTDGIQHCCYMLAHLGDTANPMGIATDWRVHLHELGGHGILYEHVGGANFGFSHSAGDSMAMIVCDPDSNAPDRFFLLPFVPAVARRSDRPVATWAWGGINDAGGYSSEQILSTTLFRVYRSIGGDSPALSRRRFASELMTYLILRTISTFTPATNPATALPFCNAMMATDLLNWTSRGISGGAYNKVVRWSFEKQGLFQPAGAPSPVTTEGAPPAVDVYIEDGRHGEYQFLAAHWNCASIWNNNSTTFNGSHEEPILSETNYAYVKVKNRGTQIATGVTVRAFHTKPGAGLTWPTDFEEMTYTGPAIGTINPNSMQEITVGPFEWSPNINAYGHDCMLVVVSATNDPSNIDNFSLGETIEEWRLVPNDNNIGQRNVNPVPGGDGLNGLVLGLQDKSFWAGNPSRKAALMSVNVELPSLLKKKGWNLRFKGVLKEEFRLKPGEKKELVFDLTTGEDFTKAEVESSLDRNIVVSVLADGALIGGMTYYLDANLKKPINSRGSETKDCAGHAKQLLKCLNISEQHVKSVKVSKISLDIEMGGDACKC